MSSYIEPQAVVESMADSGHEKTTLPVWQLVLRGALAAYLLGAATTIAVMAEVETGTSTSGEILGIWLPIFAFFALGYEHAVVNLFVMPAGMMLGAPVTIADWWLWNQMPVLVENLIGGVTLTGLGLYFSHRTRVRTAEEIEAGG